ncbi:molybdenum cofactor biosynthesis protein B [Gammaproteobacteria bacterium 42_54_T18]|nr:molybdenum cofactor biosynthesis protein B [Gammaproteobacteria bacterium 42_54_T18]
MSASNEFVPVNIAVLTVSDTRTEENDTSGNSLVENLTESGHVLADKKIVIDDVYQIRAVVSQWVADKSVEAVLITGGTGFSERDSTPEAVLPLFDKEVKGYGELFRHVSYDEIGTSTIQSRALAGLANAMVIFVMPGSTGACKTAWNGVIKDQLDATNRPCNFVALITKHRQVTAECESRS